MPRHLLVVDDSPQITDLLQQYLTGQGFSVATAQDGEEALACVSARPPDLILLDVMMPVMDGFEFMRRLRLQHEIPVIFLTARLEEMDLLTGFHLGADDYLTKPFSMSELMARVTAVLRRGGMAHETEQIGDIRIDRARRQATVRNEEVKLTRSEFELLAALVQAKGRVLSRLRLMDAMFGEVYANHDGFERTVDVHVKNLRAKIDSPDRDASYIATVYGVGYRLQDQS